MIKIAVRTVKFGATDFTPEALSSADLNDTFGFVNDNFLKSVPSSVTADPGTTSTTTTTTPFVDIPRMELSVATVNGIKVLVMLNLTGRNEGSEQSSDFQIDRDGVAQSNTVFLTDPGGSSKADFPVSIIWLDSPGTGTSVYKGQFKTTGSGTAVAIASSLTVMRLG